MSSSGYVIVTGLTVIGVAWLALMTGVCLALLEDMLRSRRPHTSERPASSPRAPARAADRRHRASGARLRGAHALPPAA